MSTATTLSIRLARFACECDALAQDLAGALLTAEDGDLMAPAAAHLELAVETIWHTLWELAKFGRSPAAWRLRLRGTLTDEDRRAILEAERRDLEAAA
jgi:hypothetical protein